MYLRYKAPEICKIVPLKCKTFMYLIFTSRTVFFDFYFIVQWEKNYRTFDNFSNCQLSARFGKMKRKQFSRNIVVILVLSMDFSHSLGQLSWNEVLQFQEVSIPILKMSKVLQLIEFVQSETAYFHARSFLEADQKQMDKNNTNMKIGLRQNLTCCLKEFAFSSYKFLT